MPEVVLQHGMFGWTDLMSSDPEDARAFYHELFGWRAQGPPEHPGEGYTLFFQGEDLVAGMAAMPPEMRESGAPSVWISYIVVDGVDEVVERVPSLGGRVLRAAMDVGESGRMALIADPSGGQVALWQAGTHAGATLFNEPHAMAWNELQTRDTRAACNFFTELLGWSWDHMENPGVGTYHVCKVGDRPNGGVMTMPPNVPDQVPPYWTVYFAVEDVDAMTERARELGGKVWVEPMDIEVGRFSVVADRQGGGFTLFQSPGS